MTTPPADLPENLRVSASARKLLNRIRAYEQQGLSGREMIRRLRAEDYHIGDRSFWRARRLAAEFRNSAARLNRSRLSYVPRRDQIPQSYFTARRWYNWIVEVRGRDRDGNTLIDHVTVTSNRLIPRGAVLDRAREMVLAEQELYKFDPNRRITFRVVEVYRAANLR